MTPRDRTIAIFGAGRMGRGIAQCFAMHGYEVQLVDSKSRPGETFDGLGRKAIAEIEANLKTMASLDVIQEPSVAAALQSIKIVPLTHAQDALSHASFVWEAVPEHLDAKAEALSLISTLAREDAVLASTTSTILPSELEGWVQAPDRFVNAHFLNPAFLMPLVEVNTGTRTSDVTRRRLLAVLESVGKIAVNGYVLARLQTLLLSEAARMVHEGAASAGDIDTAIKAGMALRFAAIGPIEFIDFGGLDVAYHACHHASKILNSPRHAPPAGLDEMMAAGKLGIKSGSGYFDWRGVDIDQYHADRLKRLVGLCRALSYLPANPAANPPKTAAATPASQETPTPRR